MTTAQWEYFERWADEHDLPGLNACMAFIAEHLQARLFRLDAAAGKVGYQVRAALQAEKGVPRPGTPASRTVEDDLDYEARRARERQGVVNLRTRRKPHGL